MRTSRVANMKRVTLELDCKLTNIILDAAGIDIATSSSHSWVIS